MNNNNEFLGGELDEPEGTNDGASLKGEYHFRCAPDYGIYIRVVPKSVQLTLAEVQRLLAEKAKALEQQRASVKEEMNSPEAVAAPKIWGVTNR